MKVYQDVIPAYELSYRIGMHTHLYRCCALGSRYRIKSNPGVFMPGMYN